MADSFSTVANTGFGSSATDPNAWMALMPGTKSPLSFADFTAGTNVPQAGADAGAPWQDLTAGGYGLRNLPTDINAASSALGPFMDLLLKRDREQAMNQFTDAGGGPVGGTPIQLSTEAAVREAQNVINAAMASQGVENQAGAAQAAARGQNFNDLSKIGTQSYFNQANQQAATAQMGAVNAALQAEKAAAAPATGTPRSGSVGGGGGGGGFGNIASATGQPGSQGFGMSSYASTPSNQSKSSEEWNAAQPKSPVNLQGDPLGNPMASGGVTPDILRDQSNAPFDQLAMSPEGTPNSGSTNYPGEDKPTWQAAPGSYYFASSMAK